MGPAKSDLGPGRGVLRMSAGLHTVHIRINDAATGRPTPVRVHFSSHEGEYFAPLGRLTDFALGNHEDVGGNLLQGSKRYAYIDGTCEIRSRTRPGRLTHERRTSYRSYSHQRCGDRPADAGPRSFFQPRG